jgi:hypothetical protein
MLFDENDTRKQIRRSPQNQVERARKNILFSQERVKEFISNLHIMNGDEVLIASLENLLHVAQQLPLEQAKRMQLEEQLNRLSMLDSSDDSVKEIRQIIRHRSTRET